MPSPILNRVEQPSLLLSPANKYLIIRDESLNGIGLTRGEVAVVRPGPVGEGRVVAVRTPQDEIIARILKYEHGMVALYPVNARYRVRYYLPHEVAIAGAVIDTYRPDAINGLDRLLLPKANAPVFRWSANDLGEVESVPLAWQLATGLPAHALHGWKWPANLVHPEHQEKIVSEWIKSLSSGRVYQVACMGRSAFGTYFPITAIAAPRMSGRGSFIEWSGICQVLI